MREVHRLRAIRLNCLLSLRIRYFTLRLYPCPSRFLAPMIASRGIKKER